jgi:hypothetical protein
MVDRAAIAAGFAALREALPALQLGVHDALHTDTYTVWRVSRDGTWVSSTDAETRGLVASGTGKLYENGAGGPTSGDTVIHIESPYRLRTTADVDIQDGDWLVLNGTRVFRVEVGKREAEADTLMNVYLAELFGVEVPA